AMPAGHTLTPRLSITCSVRPLPASLPTASANAVGFRDGQYTKTSMPLSSVDAELAPAAAAAAAALGRDLYVTGFNRFGFCPRRPTTDAANSLVPTFTLLTPSV